MGAVWIPVENEYIAPPAVWDDLRFPAQAINPVGAVTDPAIDIVQTDFPGTLLFSGTQDNMIAGVAQLPHAWRPGTGVKPHIHWMKVTGSAAAVSWEFFYRICGNAGDVAGAWSAAVVGTLVAGNQAVANNQIITSFGTINLTGYKESCMIAWRLYRRGTTDADNNQVRLLEFDIHFQSEKAGTIAEYY